jgi:hypothetical protein
MDYIQRYYPALIYLFCLHSCKHAQAMSIFLQSHPDSTAQNLRVGTIVSLDGCIPKRTVYVSDPSQLATALLRSDVIYEITEPLTFVDHITVPLTGLYLRGTCPLVSSLTRTNAGPLFAAETVVPAAPGTGTLYLSNLTLTVGTAGATIFALTGAGAASPPVLELSNVHFLDCQSLGTVTEYGRVAMDNIKFDTVPNGLTLAGPIANLSMTRLYGFLSGTGPYFISGGALAVSGGWTISNVNMLDADALTQFTDIADVFTKPGAFNVSNVSSNYAAAGAGIMPNVVYNAKVSISNCSGIRNTARVGQIQTTANFVVPSGPEPEKVNATVAVAGSTLSVHDGFTQLAAPADAFGLTYAGDPKAFFVTAEFEMSGGAAVIAGDLLAAQLYQNVAGVEQPIGTQETVAYAVADDRYPFYLGAVVVLSAASPDVFIKVTGFDATSSPKNLEPTVYSGALLSAE